MHSERFEGKSTYNFRRLFQLAINAILAFSDKPLRLTVKIGFFITILSLLTIVVYFFMYLTGAIKVLGFTSLILSFWFLSGVIIFILGFLGLYIGKIFEKVKDRPTFIINEIINIDE